MQFTKAFKDAIRSGELTCSFRRWKSPQARIGGQYNLHPKGAIEVTDIRRLPLKDAKAATTKRSGFASRNALGEHLKASDDDLVYLVEFRYLGDIAVTQPFKANVRKLKKLGLTESLEIGYRLTARGQQVLGKL